ncbi:hypothetical protein HYV11_01245 [Candidatus Dependentiae bacterium]|nr:hypothetical protein [Candidatus Dependentiae bacterium]
MKKFYGEWFYYFIFIVFCSWFHVVFSGFSGVTLVKTPNGYIPIKQLKVGDQVYGVSKEGIISPTIITHKVKCKRSTYFSISIDNQTLTVANGQKFLLPLKHLWRKAKKLHEKDEVLTAFHDSIQVSVVKQKHKQKKFYDVRLQKDHAFLVTPQDIIVHNMPLFNIGVLISFEGFKFAVEAVWTGVCFFGVWLGSKFLRSEKKVSPVMLSAANAGLLNDQFDDHDNCLFCEKNDVSMKRSENIFHAQNHEQLKGEILSSLQQNIDFKSKKQKQKNQKKVKSGVVASCGCPGPDDDDPDADDKDDEFEKKHPNGRYQESPKHHQNSSENIGKPPRNGQAALDSSIEVMGKNYRVAIQDGKVVILMKTSSKVYHGYIVEKFKDLPRQVKNALWGHDLIRSIQSGKIK